MTGALYGDDKERVRTRETREGWPLLTFETEVNGDSKSTNERGTSLIGLFDMSCRYDIFLGALVQYKIIFSSPHTFSLY
jgi:hypothetical protein